MTPFQTGSLNCIIYNKVVDMITQSDLYNYVVIFEQNRLFYLFNNNAPLLQKGILIQCSGRFIF